MTTKTLALIAVALLAGVSVLLYNGLVRLRNRIDNAWSQIGVELRRRWDLIPNAVDTVKGYAGHEREILDEVVRARAASMEAQGVEDQGQAENLITGSLRQLFALAEAYPGLMASQNFLALQGDLAQTEGRIAFARQYYNEAVLRYDNRRGTLPGNIVAAVGRFGPRQYFQVEAEAQAPVRVDFS